MVLCMKYEMKWYLWIGWLWQAIKGTTAFPLHSGDTAGGETGHQIRYVLISLVGLTFMILCIISCLCCRRQRRASKGFQEFKDGSAVASSTILDRTLSTLELEVPRSTSNNRVEFEPLPVDRLVPERLPWKPKPPSPSLFDREFESSNDHQIPNREWFSPDLHIPRERLKYLREIGRGWFGKVVEGTQDLYNSDKTIENFGNSATNNQTRGIVVRILTEEATASEKAWFLGEALPYLKLRHRNLLELFGTCLETDPYLLLFESCPTGDLKSFLRSNRGSEALDLENVPLRMAMDVSSALEHMHNNGFAHTDLSARNCLVSPNLSIKLGDYGIGVEKYPEDYYVVGDRALPIRWSAPESLVCTDTTIETRAITPKANLWSFAILLYEIASWGERPYNSLGDEQVIEMILSLNFHSHLKLEGLGSKNLVDTMKSCWKINANERIDLDTLIGVLRGKDLDFEERWETSRPNMKGVRSASLKELRESMDSDLWQVPMEKPSTTPQARFRLGPDESVKPELKTQISQESGSETEEESWRGRVERGAYTEKVKQKSKSIADLMVLVHIDDDSEAEWSLGPQLTEKPRKKLSSSGSVGDLPSVLADEFDEALRKLRDTIPPNSQNALLLPNLNTSNPETADVVSPAKEIIHVTIEPIPREHIDPDFTSTPKSKPTPEEQSSTLVDVELWQNALDFELERKSTGFDSMNFEEIPESEKNEPSSLPDLDTQSAPDTPQSRGAMSVDNEDFSEEAPEKQKPDIPEEEDDRKHLSTPDDERSSDSGFRDKESCEEEENNVSSIYNTGLSHSMSEEEQLKILYELDTILDAEYCGSFEDDRPSNNLRISTEDESTESLSQATEVLDLDNDKVNGTSGCNVSVDSVIRDVDKGVGKIECTNCEGTGSSGNFGRRAREVGGSEVKPLDNEDNEDVDDDSSTMSLRSDNSYVSFNLDEEFVAAIRNELRDKLPRAQLAIVEAEELRDEEEPSVNSVQDTDTNSWGSSDEQEGQERSSGNIDIAIRYNIYGTPLSPILEERESAVTSESYPSRDDSREDSRDASMASRLSLSEDVIVVDTRTNKVVLVEGSDRNKIEEDRDTYGDISDEESMDCGTNNSENKCQNRASVPLPSPEEESKWQAQFPIPLQLQDDLMSTSFSTEHEWDSQDEEEEGGGEERAEVEDEENSSSSGEFVWKRYNEESNKECEGETPSSSQDVGSIGDRIDEEDEEEEEEEFTPSAWDATLAPHRSALKSPEKTLKSGDQKKNVWFKKQRYHCVYEYPKETHSSDFTSPAATTWEPTSYADWEEMMDEPRLDVYPMDYDESNNLPDEEFFVSSGNRPFQFQARDGKYVSQFFPGANIAMNEETGPTPHVQLGELRHTRDKLKLNLPMNQDMKTVAQLNEECDESDECDSDGERTDGSDGSKDRKDNSSESSASRDDQSFRSVIRSQEDSMENLKKNHDGNAESADEVSELDGNKTDNMSHPKSSGRPLVIANSSGDAESHRDRGDMATQVDAEVGAEVEAGLETKLDIVETKLDTEAETQLEELEIKVERKLEAGLESKLEGELEKKLERKLEAGLESKLEGELEKKLEAGLELKLGKAETKLEPEVGKLGTDFQMKLETDLGEKLETELGKTLETLEPDLEKKLEMELGKPLETDLEKKLETELGKTLEKLETKLSENLRNDSGVKQKILRFDESIGKPSIDNIETCNTDKTPA